MNTDHYLRYSEDKLVSAFDQNREASTVGRFIHGQFRSMILSTEFPCSGAKTAFVQNSYRYGIFDKLGDEETTQDLAKTLKVYLSERDQWGTNFTAFVVSFKDTLSLSQEKFSELLWKTLEQLHAIDETEWPSERSYDPESPNFAFCFNGHPLFVVGMHGASPRYARRFAWPTLFFNLHKQFDFLREKNTYTKFRDTVRKKDIRLQGHINPVVSDHGTTSEAIQYAGEIKGKEWKCPFRHKATITKSEER